MLSYITLGCPRYAQGMHKVYQRYVSDMPQICPGYAQDILNLWLGSLNIFHSSYSDYLPNPGKNWNYWNIPNNWDEQIDRNLVSECLCLYRYPKK